MTFAFTADSFLFETQLLFLRGYYLKKESFFPNQLPIFTATPYIFEDDFCHNNGFDHFHRGLGGFRQTCHLLDFSPLVLQNRFHSFVDSHE